MLSKVGLARLECPSCTRTSYVSARSLLQADSVACTYCYEAIPVADVEANDPSLSRVLAILRQLADARAIHKQRGEDAVTASGALLSTASAMTQMA